MKTRRKFTRFNLTAAGLLLLASCFVQAAPAHRCAEAAKTQAQKLLAFHFGADERIEVENSAKSLPPIRNPAQKNQYFDVLEIWGYVYKGQYRMRMLYARIPDECVLMGQEILEHAAL